MMYTYSNNDQPFKGDNGPLIGLLTWPDTNNAANWLTPAGTRVAPHDARARRRSTTRTSTSTRTSINAKTNRIIANAGFTLTPFSWGYLKTNIGVDAYTNQNLMLRHPESAFGVHRAAAFSTSDDDITRNLNAQTLFNVNEPSSSQRAVARAGCVGNAIQDNKSTVDGVGRRQLPRSELRLDQQHAEPKSSRTVISQRRLVSAFGQATLDFQRLPVPDAPRAGTTGRRRFRRQRNSFFYPSVSRASCSPTPSRALQRYMTGKLRAAYAEVGRDAAPYSYRTTLESKTTAYGGYGYGFTGPNPHLGRSSRSRTSSARS